MNFVKDFWEVIWEVLGWFQFITFVDPWEEGIVVQAGLFRRVLKPGWRLHLPFEIDEITLMNIRQTSMELAAQSVTTRDGKEIVIRGVLLWEIFDIKKTLLDVEDATGTLGNIAVGLIQECVEVTDLADIRTRAFRTLVKRHIQKQARKWGISVRTVRFQDLTVAKSYRIFGGLAAAASEEEE